MNGQDWIPSNQEGEQLAPIILDGISYLPVKSIVEATGGQVQWQESTKTIEIVSTFKKSLSRQMTEAMLKTVVTLSRNTVFSKLAVMSEWCLIMYQTRKDYRIKK